MRITIILFTLTLFLFGCSDETAAPVAWEDKTDEQQHKERVYMTECHAKHIKERDFEVCKTEFEKEFGYPYLGGSQTK